MFVGKLRFDDSFKYDPAVHSITCHAHDDDKHIYCIVPLDFLHDRYGADKIGPGQAYLQHLQEIRELAQQFYDQRGAPKGELIVYPQDSR